MISINRQRFIQWFESLTLRNKRFYKGWSWEYFDYHTDGRGKSFHRVKVWRIDPSSSWYGLHYYKNYPTDAQVYDLIDEYLSGHGAKVYRDSYE
jgi:hypothetical protein